MNDRFNDFYLLFLMGCIEQRKKIDTPITTNNLSYLKTTYSEDDVEAQAGSNFEIYPNQKTRRVDKKKNEYGTKAKAFEYDTTCQC